MSTATEANPEIRVCNLCKLPAKSQCAGCHQVAYCTKEHQKSDWKRHKKECKPYQIIVNERLGRHLVATRDLPAGEIICKEAPLLWGPSEVTIPVCLGCGQALTAANATPCIKCGWPMCSSICQNSPAHIPECSYTMKRGEKVSIRHLAVPNPSYQCITPLRCLYHKQFLPDSWAHLNRLQSHCEQRRKTAKYESDRVLVATFIRRFFKLDVDDEVIMRICGIINVNGHEVPLSEPPYVAVYKTASMFEHNCTSNCSKTFTSDGHLLIITGPLGVRKGEHLSICYTDPLWGTTNRRHHLYESKFFWCECERCQDVTEKGTYFSCINCTNRGCSGIATPPSFLTLDNPINVHWECQKCHKLIKNEEVNDLMEELGKRLQDMQKGSIHAGKVYIEHALQYVPGNHFYITDVKVALSELIGQEFKGGLATVSDEDLLWKMQICKELLELIDLLCPAEQRGRGLLLFELHASIAEYGQRKGTRKEEGPDYLYDALLQSRMYLQRAISALHHEPDILPEGKICKQARVNLKNIDALLASVQCAMKHPTS